MGNVDGGSPIMPNNHKSTVPILLCRPCNGKKSNPYTLAGLRKVNKREGWMRDEASAESAQVRARRKADTIKALR